MGDVLVAEPGGGRFAWDTERDLRRAGWTPGRRVDVERWALALADEGLQMHAAAAGLLSEFGGLSVDISGPGIDCARQPFSFFPTSCSGEGDRISEWGTELRRHFYPLGETNRREFLIVIDEVGEIYLMMDRVGTLGVRDQGLESLVRGKMPEWIAVYMPDD
jgi:hypothetical protein